MVCKSMYPSRHVPGSNQSRKKGVDLMLQAAMLHRSAQYQQPLHAHCMQVLIPAPFWVSYPEIAKLAGAKPVIVDCPAQDDFLLTPAALKARLTPASRLLILCTPSNPTGSVYSRCGISGMILHVCNKLPSGPSLPCPPPTCSLLSPSPLPFL